jgi:hypothetical protein
LSASAGVQRGVFGRMYASIEIRLFGDRLFLRKDAKTTFMIVDVCPKGHPYTPHTCPEASPSAAKRGFR